jgi:hypothetical protein
VIDASRSPVPAWKRVLRFLAVAILIAAVGLLIWTKDLHHRLLNQAPKSHPAAVVLHRTGGEK